MSTFRYYITYLMNGTILGTNNENTAQGFANTDDAFVVDVETNEMLVPFEEGEVPVRLPIKDCED